MRLRQNNIQAAFIILTFLVITMIGFYVTMKPFALVMDKLSGDSHYTSYITQQSCSSAGGYWVDGACKALPDARSAALVIKVRYYWLMAGTIFILSLIVWLVLASLKRDPFIYQGGQY